MAIRLRRTIFDAPLSDEIALSERARSYLPGLSSPPTSSEINRLCQTHSNDLAARVFYEGILKSQHGEFIRRIDSLPTQNTVNPRPGQKLIIVPGMFYKEHPEVGADGTLARTIADRFGFKSEIIALKSTGSITQNSDILAQRLEHEHTAPIWLLSLSKGSSEVRHYLQHRRPNPNLQGWISVAGTPKGSPLVEAKLKSLGRRLFYRSLCAVTGVSYGAIEEMAPTHAYWRKAQWPAALDIIQVVPIPLSSHIQGMLRSRHKKLLRSGPNDGFVPVTDALELPGKIYPVWGSDHFMRTPKLCHLLYRFFNYIAQQKCKKDEL
jgi:hypothetical protein